MHDPVDTAVSEGVIVADPGANTWAIETPALALRWGRDAGGDLRLVSLRTAGREWVSSPVPLFATASGSTPLSFDDVESSVVGGRSLRLRGTLAPSGLTVTMSVTVYESDSVVVADVEAENQTGGVVELGSLSSLHLSVPRVEDARLAVVAGGRWDESLPPRGYRLHTTDLDEIGRGIAFGAAEDGRSSGEHVPWFALLDDAGGLFAALAWSGRWQFGVTRRDADSELTFGISDFSHRMAPGEKLALPSLVLAGFAGDLDDGANAWRRWASTQWMPSTPPDWPWIQYNHWYAYYGDIDATRLLEEARLAASAGCEVFVIDDGWFRGRRPDSYFAGWGDWVEDRDKFPDGLHAFGEQVRSLGMRFGLWVEPEAVNPDSDLYRDHPDWVHRPLLTLRNQYVLDLGKPEVEAWAGAMLRRLLTEHPISYLKWDMNRALPAGGSAAHTEAYYRLLRLLRAEFPHVTVEACAGGGGRVDNAVLALSDVVWPSDETGPRDRLAIQHGFLSAYPPHVMSSWVTDEPDLLDTTPASLEFRFVVAMAGVLGIGADL
ncbi:MAG TPA: glycoside hydrolase family 36 protein, partial [Thermomicrobiales bacterium]|nr:glycoside hydrolase family 36 protein [Thermomicrobiales bacterium]